MLAIHLKRSHNYQRIRNSVVLRRVLSSKCKHGFGSVVPRRVQGGGKGPNIHTNTFIICELSVLVHFKAGQVTKSTGSHVAG